MAEAERRVAAGHRELVRDRRQPRPVPRPRRRRAPARACWSASGGVDGLERLRLSLDRGRPRRRRARRARWPARRPGCRTCTCRCSRAPTTCCARMRRRYGRERYLARGRAGARGARRPARDRRRHRRLPRRERRRLRGHARRGARARHWRGCTPSRTRRGRAPATAGAGRRARRPSSGAARRPCARSPSARARERRAARVGQRDRVLVERRDATRRAAAATAATTRHGALAGPRRAPGDVVDVVRRGGGRRLPRGEDRMIERVAGRPAGGAPGAGQRRGCRCWARCSPRCSSAEKDAGGSLDEAGGVAVLRRERKRRARGGGELPRGGRARRTPSREEAEGELIDGYMPAALEAGGARPDGRRGGGRGGRDHAARDGRGHEAAASRAWRAAPTAARCPTRSSGRWRGSGAEPRRPSRDPAVVR